MNNCPICKGEIEVLQTSTLSALVDQEGEFELNPFDIDVEIDILCIECGSQLNKFFDYDLNKNKGEIFTKED